MLEKNKTTNYLTDNNIFMGTWGTGISSNDTYADIYEQFIDLYNEGYDAPEITERLIDENQETINLPEDATNFWFALANGQWECKSLDNKILSKVEHIIQSGEDLRVWEELEASPADLKVRKSVLTKFLAKLNTEKEKPRKRTKKKLYNSVFKKGDCLIYKMDNGNYGGAFVLTDEQETQIGKNYIAITTIDKTEKPTIKDFKNAEVYTRRAKETSFIGTEMQQTWVDQPQIAGYYAASFKSQELNIEVIGQLPIYTDYKIRIDRQVGSPWSALKSVIPFKDEYIKINGSAKTKVKISKWTTKNWLKHWL